MLSAPLMLGADPRQLSTAALRILTAPELLAINQDPLARQARRVWTEGALQVRRKDSVTMYPTTCYSRLTAHGSRLTTHYSLLTY